MDDCLCMIIALVMFIARVVSMIGSHILLIECLFAMFGAKVVRLSSIFRRISGLFGIEFHPTNRIFGHLCSPLLVASSLPRGEACNTETERVGTAVGQCDLLFLIGRHRADQCLMLIVRKNIARLTDGCDEIHSLSGAQFLDVADLRLHLGVIE